MARDSKLEFWHLTFQEHLAARAIAGLPDDVQQQILLGGTNLYRPEWRETLLLYAGLLASKQGREKVDELFTRLLGKQGSTLKEQARCAGIVGAILADLRPTGYEPPDSGYRQLLDKVLLIFDNKLKGDISLKTRVEAAEALGQAGDPRLSAMNKWVRIVAGQSEIKYPDHSAGDYEIGRYPVTVEEFSRYVDGGGSRPGDWDKQLEYPNRPVVNVSWHSAQEYCVWARANLPTETQWKLVAQGQDGRQYPWGAATPTPLLANYNEARIGAPTPVGLFPEGATPEGVLDLAGNVWEWVSDATTSLLMRTAMGGSWKYDHNHLSASMKLSLGANSGFEDVGFRCCRNQ